MGGDDLSRGRVQYCFNGSWYSVCGTLLAMKLGPSATLYAMTPLSMVKAR